MNNQSSNQDRTVAAFIHLSSFSQFFIPFGNFIFPLIFWTAKKNDPFVNEHGKQALNFQISLFLYFIFFITIAVAGIIIVGASMNLQGFPFDHEEWIGNPLEAGPAIIYILVMSLLFLSLLVLYIYGTISATIKAGEGKLYQYPLTINFLRGRDVSPENNSKPGPSTPEK